jgi:hypothetical protein
MGMQNLLVLLLCLIVVGIAVAIGVSSFTAHSDQANKDGLTASLVRIAADAQRFKTSLLVLGGGNGAYDRSGGAASPYEIPRNMAEDNYGSYSLVAAQAHTCSLKGVSSRNSEWYAICFVDDEGATTIQYVGW